MSMTREAALRFASDESDWINDYGLALGTFYTELLINKIYDDFEAQLKAKDERIKELDCRAYHAEGILVTYNHPKDKKFYDAKARSIVAMLFWESRKTLTEYRNTEHCDALYNYYYGQKQQFIEAYAMLKDGYGIDLSKLEDK